MGADSELSERSSEPAVDGNLKSGEGGVPVSMDGSGEAGGRGLAEQAASAGASLTTVNLTARSSSAAGGVGDSGSAALTGTAPPILVRDSHSHTSTAAAVAFPFNELSSPRLLTVARQTAPRPPGDKQADEPKRKTRPGTKRRTAPSTAPSDLSSCSAPSASSHSSTSSSPRTTPTRVGERDSFEAATGGPSAGAGSYKGTVVRFSKLDTNNWKPLLAFRKRLIAGEVAPESSTASAAPTAEASETTMARGVRNMACRPISAAKKQQILDLACTAMSVSQIAAEVGVAETTVRATCRQATQPPRRRRRFTSDDLQRAQQLHAQGRTYIEIGLELGFGRDTVKKHLAAVQVRGAHH